MDISFLVSAINAALVTTPELGLLADWLLKSVVIVLFTGLLIAVLSRRLVSGSKHLIWLNIYVCTAFLPLLAWLARPIRIAGESTPALFTLDVTPAASNSLTTYSKGAIDVGSIILIVYLLPIALLLVRLAASAFRTYRIGNRADNRVTKPVQGQLEALYKKLDMSRPVRLKYSAEISSPLSFGLFSPLILLPDSARHWHPALLDDVLTHELSHIKRLDWLSM
ncbi:MAG: M56 family metallopeptidase, partial [Gammaproteobacteria bacterium]